MNYIMEHYGSGLLAILGNHILAQVLILSDYDSCGLACSQCDYYDEEVYLDDPEIQSRIVLPPTENWDGQSLDKPQVWLPALLSKFGGDIKLKQSLIPYLFVEYTCPECGRRAPLLDFAKQCYWGE